MTRKYAHSRRLERADAIYDCMTARFPIVRRHENLQRQTLAQQMGALADASLLVGPHGAGLTQLIWLPNGAAVVEITKHPPNQGRSVANIYANMAAWSRHPYAYLAPPVACPTLLATVRSVVDP